MWKKELQWLPSNRAKSNERVPPLGNPFRAGACQMSAWLVPDNGDDSLYIFIYGFIGVIYIIYYLYISV